jgi:hypothetical protein
MIPFRRRILGAVTDPHAVRRLLAALGLAAEPPPCRPVSASCPASAHGIRHTPHPSQSARRPAGAGSHPRLPESAPALAGPARGALDSGHPGDDPAGLTAQLG